MVFAGFVMLFFAVAVSASICSKDHLMIQTSMRGASLHRDVAKDAGVPNCMVWGDPHIKVFDGTLDASVAAENLTGYYGYGDFWLVQSPRIQIQARYWSTGATSRYQTKIVAISGELLSGHILVVEPLDGNISWDGNPILQQFPSTFVGGDSANVRYHNDSDSIDVFRRHLPVRIVEASIQNGEVRVVVNRWKDHIDVLISMPKLPGGQEGHCGNNNGDPIDDTPDRIRQRSSSVANSPDSILPPWREFQLKGCFRDAADRDLPTARGFNLTMQECALACSGSAYFGRQYLHECFCGDSFGRYGELPPNECDCDGANIGGFRNCIYEYGAPTATEAPPRPPCSPVERRAALTRCCQAGNTETSFVEACVFDVCMGGDGAAEESAIAEQEFDQVVGQSIGGSSSLCASITTTSFGTDRDDSSTSTPAQHFEVDGQDTSQSTSSISTTPLAITTRIVQTTSPPSSASTTSSISTTPIAITTRIVQTTSPPSSASTTANIPSSASTTANIPSTTNFLSERNTTLPQDQTTVVGTSAPESSTTSSIIAAERPCPEDQYRLTESSVVIPCNRSLADVVPLDLPRGRIAEIVDLPIGTVNVSFTLQGDNDFDTRLVDATTDQCIMGFNCWPCGQRGCEKRNYAGFNLTFSGDDTTRPVVEVASIMGIISRPLKLTVNAYRAAVGSIEYQVGNSRGVCQIPSPGCGLCSAYRGCSSGTAPLCDGSHQVQCIATA